MASVLIVDGDGAAMAHRSFLATASSDGHSYSFLVA